MPAHLMCANAVIVMRSKTSSAYVRLSSKTSPHVRFATRMSAKTSAHGSSGQTMLLIRS